MRTTFQIPLLVFFMQLMWLILENLKGFLKSGILWRLENPTFPPPPSQTEDIEHWTQAMIIDATKR